MTSPSAMFFKINPGLMAAWVSLILLLAANCFFWNETRGAQSRWGNVPPAPSASTAAMPGLGDPQAAYRLYGYFLQNLGNTGGNFKNLKDYDYGALKNWFFLENSLNDRSDFVPMLAAYYFGSVLDSPDKTAPLVDYLAVAGEAPYPQKWRWLGQAVYQARYNEKNMPRALALANQLAAIDGAAAWAKQMPAFIQLDMGNRRAAYDVMRQMLSSEYKTLNPNEVNFMQDMICTRILTADEATKDPICKGLK